MTAHSKELNSDRLLQLSGEVSRIASTLAQLSNQAMLPGGAPDFNDGPIQADAEVSVDTVRSVIRARRLRDRFFEEELFADPAWDMLLHLLYAELMHQPVTVTSLCEASAVPATTALRWLKALTDKDLVIRHDDPLDARRKFVELSREASASLRRYFAEVGHAPTI
jgi:DNA-binding MarR family transcriptional regulator